MYKKLIILAALLSVSFSSFAIDGMIDIKSNHSVKATADKFEKILLSKGMTVFARIKHSAAAKKVGINIDDMELVIFGNPKVGSPLMKCAPTVGIDLPQKALIRQDSHNNVWISYNDPSYLKNRHNIQGCDKVLKKVSGALSKLTGAAAK